MWMRMKCACLAMLEERGVVGGELSEVGVFGVGEGEGVEFISM